MAKGDAVGNVASVDAAAYMTIQPGANKEGIIHNIYTATEAELYMNTLVACIVTLEGGTNAAPTGQGLTDKNFLNAKGRTVTTN